MAERLVLRPLSEGDYDVSLFELIFTNGTCRLAGSTHFRSPFLDGHSDIRKSAVVAIRPSAVVAIRASPAGWSLTRYRGE
jgi:hypothetical protein